MAATKSAAGPSYSVGVRDAVSQETARPVNAPPGAESQSGGTGAVAAESVPISLSDAELARMMGSSTALAAPSLEPPSLKETAGVGGVTATVWKAGKVTSLWSINQNRNSWVGLDSGIGWQKFANNSDTAIVAFTLLASHARDAQGTNSIRVETTDNMVHEIYVW